MHAQDLPEEIQQCIRTWTVHRRFFGDGKLKFERVSVGCESKSKALRLALKYLCPVGSKQSNFDAVRSFWAKFYSDVPDSVVNANDAQALNHRQGCSPESTLPI